MKTASSKRTVIALAEWQTQEIPGLVLTSEDRALAQGLSTGEDGRLSIEEMRSCVRISAKSWVGVVHFKHFEIRVRPKLAGESHGLVQMLSYASDLDYLKRLPAGRTLAPDGENLLDLLALLLMEECKRLLRSGLFADYVETEGDLGFVRGRILGDQQILRRFGRLDKIACRYDEIETDLPENQVLAAALRKCSGLASTEQLRSELRRMTTLFEEVCAPVTDFKAARSRITYHRQNEHYREAHSLAWLIADGLGIDDIIAVGKTRCFAFLLDMNRLFEMFIGRAIGQLISGTDLRARYQCADKSIIWNETRSRPYSRVIPDVLIESQSAKKARVTVDAKYKLYDERKISPEDVYQCFLYAYAYATGGNPMPRALILYPSTARSSQLTQLHVRSGGVAAAEVLALGVSITDALDELKRNEPGPATQPILDAINLGLGCQSCQLV